MTESPLDEQLDARRLELDMQWIDIQKRANLSRQTLYNIRKTGRGDSRYLARLERAVLWAPGSIDAINSGGEATPIDALDDIQATFTVEQLAAALLARLDSPEDAYDLLARTIRARRTREGRGAAGDEGVAAG